ncbi:tryptophan 7-halogenase [Gilvimarinus sp. SDUM040013]|uniref:Tryptophan halogenase family protein n=1 Tax=Gilvimarinus gilvus TaxID=3058038 RepID=A0ABU4RWP4_9GAMM|nr:tryptophan halogenase family protein [Gilvimarinus sp. SDUM040013]MDO3385663.1 tryptophan 7-halogenase [Gilvimarinus sp. SDUM040013]MDX6849301.1 tryptophan halogenase family protein [Gilvimarinus sp. SDUM040013]
MSKSVLIVGGGTAGWITAAYMARMLAADTPGGVSITLVESDEIGILGVGEGTFPIIRKTLGRIGLDESELIRDADATFKQGIRFNNWKYNPADVPNDTYFHPFQVCSQHTDMDLLPYWLLGVAGQVPWAQACTVQESVVNAKLAPKLITHPNYNAPLNYAYHFDAGKLAQVVRRRAMEMGVKRLIDTIDDVKLDETGAIASVRGRDHGELTADLYIDCTGFRSRLIGETLGSEFTSYKDQLFCDRAVAMQVPYDRADQPIPSCTYATAQNAGWTWDIGLHNRRGLGYVYSSRHCSDDEAVATLRRHIGPAAQELSAKKLSFEAGFRKIQWHKNCIGIGLSVGFIEPLEATGISFAEVAALMVCNLFPWSGDTERSARQFNDAMTKRFEHVIDFIKLHYYLSQRTDTAFWRDNREASSASDYLKGKLEQWKYRPPSFLDIDASHDIFDENSWQYILYGMDFKTDISNRAGALRFYEDAKREFESIRQQSLNANNAVPAHRDLIQDVVTNGFRPPQGGK